LLVELEVGCEPLPLKLDVGCEEAGGGARREARRASISRQTKTPALSRPPPDVFLLPVVPDPWGTRRRGEDGGGIEIEIREGSRPELQASPGDHLTENVLDGYWAGYARTVSNRLG